MADTPELLRAENRQLRDENTQLRDLVVSLSATLLREIALHLPKPDLAATTADANHLMQEAEKCFRCARTTGLRPEIAEGLEVAGNELMARAVEIETARQRKERSK
jgi:hypothetical protein